MVGILNARYRVLVPFYFILDEILLVGTRQGHLLMYSVVPRLSDQKYDVQLMRYNKTFSKKPIVQLEVIPEEQLLVSLTGTYD